MVQKKRVAVSLLSVLPLLTAAAQTAMDCDAMFQESDDMIRANNKLSVANKVEFYEMAADAYRQCEKGEEKTAKDLFQQIFNTSGRM